MYSHKDFSGVQLEYDESVRTGHQQRGESSYLSSSSSSRGDTSSSSSQAGLQLGQIGTPVRQLGVHQSHIASAFEEVQEEPDQMAFSKRASIV